MAFLAVLLQDRQHIAMVRHLAVLGDHTRLTVNFAADRLRRGDRNRPARDQFGERLAQIEFRDLGMLLEPFGIHVVDSAAIFQDEVAVEHEDLRREVGLESVGGAHAFILEDGKRGIEFLGRLGDLRRRFIFVDGQAPNRDAELAELVGDLREGAHVAFRDGAFEGKKNDDDRFLVFELIETMGFAGVILEGEVRHFFAELGLRWLLGGNLNADGQSQCQGEEGMENDACSHDATSHKLHLSGVFYRRLGDDNTGPGGGMFQSSGRARIALSKLASHLLRIARIRYNYSTPMKSSKGNRDGNRHYNRTRD